MSYGSEQMLALTVRVSSLRTLSFCAVRRYRRRALESINHDLLSDGITSENHAWFCGLTVADAHIKLDSNLIQYGFQMSDYELLSRIKSIAEFDRKITLTINQNGHPMAHLNLVSQRITHDFYALFPCDWHKKSATLDSPEMLFDGAPEPLIRAFIRGLTEGDGTFAFNLSKATLFWGLLGGSESFIDGVSNLIHEYCHIKCNKYIKTKPNGGYYYEIRVENQSQMLVFAEWLYQDKGLICNRKYDRFLFQKAIMEQCDTKDQRRAMIRMYRDQEISQKHKVHAKLMTEFFLKESKLFHFAPAFGRRFDLLRCKMKSTAD